jgi:hypothetical protein
MHLLGIKPAPGTKPQLLRDGRWIDFYEVVLRW